MENVSFVVRVSLLVTSESVCKRIRSIRGFMQVVDPTVKTAVLCLVT